MLNFREKNCENVAKINGKIVRKKYGREIINYDIINYCTGSREIFFRKKSAKLCKIRIKFFVIFAKDFACWKPCHTTLRGSLQYNWLYVLVFIY